MLAYGNMTWGQRRITIHEELTRFLITGRLAAGERVNEGALAERLGTSRTPVREALFGLEQEGFLYRDGKGLVVEPFTTRGARDIYLILGPMEATALKQSGVAARATSRELLSIRDKMRDAIFDPNRYLDLHRRFHITLLTYCPNLRLLEMTHRLSNQALRYEHAYMDQVGRRARTIEPGDGIIMCLERGDIERAANLLEMSWTSRIGPIESWIRSQPELPRRSVFTERRHQQGAA
jgi:DNA-binding GntR family transcriptional regulator